MKRYHHFVVLLLTLLNNMHIQGAQVPPRETTCEAFALIFANKQTAQKSTDELAVIINDFFPTSSHLNSAFCTAPTELVSMIINYLEEPRSAQGNTPLMIFLEIAQHYGYSREKISFVITSLLHHGAHLDVCNNAGTTPLHLAVTCALHEVVDILLAYTDQVDVNAENNLGETPLHTIVRITALKQLLCLKDALLIIPSLIRAGANPNLQIKHGETPLHTAIMAHQDQIVEALLTAPTIDISIRNTLEETPLEYARELSTLLHNQQPTYTPEGWQAVKRTRVVPLARIISLLEAHQTKEGCQTS